VPTKAALSLPLLSWTEDKKYDERLLGPVMEKDITQQLLSWAKQTQLGQISLIFHQSNQSSIRRN